MNLQFQETSLPGVVHIVPSAFNDHRGWLAESYNEQVFIENGITDRFNQEKHSFSKQNVLRGLHFQKEPYGQGKLVRCSYGKIFDVAVDIRDNSSTYGKWIGYELSSANNELLYIPPGFAHGFVVLSEEGAYFSYLISGASYNASADAGLYYSDPQVGIDWPVDVSNLILSDKDKNLPYLSNLITRV
jgi:dTDP-4-dehydrorhamnose 3,5-epimerase